MKIHNTTGGRIFDGVGPVCWQSCPAGYQDHGAPCFQHIFSWFFKASYSRGAGSASWA